MTRANNGLGIVIRVLLAFMLTTTVMQFPAAGSERPQPVWVWDEEGRVHDATGQYRGMTEEETLAFFGTSKKIYAPTVLTATGGDASNGGGK